MLDLGIASWYLWLGFSGLILLFLLIDLGVFHRKSHTVSMKEAIVWSLVWFGTAMLFNAFLWFKSGQVVALEFFTGYIIEKSLSFDNLFVILLIFTSFRIKAHLQHKVLFWGILGALVLRAALIIGGSALVQAFHWTFYIFGAFLVFTGVRFFWETEQEVDHEKHVVVRLARRFVRVSTGAHETFFVRENGLFTVSMLFLTVLVIEVSDVVFALDSIPAIFGVTTDPFIVWTSNVFAILGLRSLYFVIARMQDLFVHVKYGLGIILVFVGAKMLAEDFVHVPLLVSLGIILGILVTSILTSVAFHKKEPPQYIHE